MKWIVVNSGKRVGSTLVYNLIRAAAPASIGLVEPWVVDRIGRCKPAVPTLAKAHEWIGASPNVTSIVVMRDPRDVAASWLRFPEGGPDDLFEILDGCWRTIRDMYDRSAIFRYESYWKDPRPYAAAMFSRLELDPRRAELAVAAVDPAKTREASLAIKEGDYDTATELRHAHVSETLGMPGAWEHVLEGLAGEVVDRYPQWMKKGGYE